MQDLLKWTLNTIRDNEDLLWLEERRFEWVPLLPAPISTLMSGAAIIVVTDQARDWFGDYVVRSFNDPSKNRPFLPIFTLNSICPTTRAIEGDRLKDVIDMLDVAFGQYIFWYIGRRSESILDFAQKKDDNLLWIFDEEAADGFMLKSFDKRLDSKLISLYQLLDKTIYAALFGTVDLHG